MGTNNIRNGPTGPFNGFRVAAVIAFGQLAASGVTTASVSVAGLQTNDSIVPNPRAALAQGIAYARAPATGTLVVGLNNAATVTVAAQTVTFDVQVLKNP